MTRIALAALLLCSAAAHAEDAEGCKDSPLLQRMPGSQLTSCDKKEFDEMEIPAAVDADKNVQSNTDGEGKAKANLDLSKKRAAAVEEWLVKNGVEAKRLTTEGYGSSKPVGENKTDEGKAKNRRVELVKI